MVNLVQVALEIIQHASRDLLQPSRPDLRNHAAGAKSARQFLIRRTEDLLGRHANCALFSDSHPFAQDASLAG
jgi:hypothetical protein